MFMYKNNLLRLRNNKNNPIIIPPNIRHKIMEYFHTNYASLHQSAKRVYKIMKQFVYS